MVIWHTATVSTFYERYLDDFGMILEVLKLFNIWKITKILILTTPVMLSSAGEALLLSCSEGSSKHSKHFDECPSLQRFSSSAKGVLAINVKELLDQYPNPIKHSWSNG